MSEPYAAEFFVKASLKKLIAKVLEENNPEGREEFSLFKQVLQEILENPEKFDKHCEFTLTKYNRKFEFELMRFTNSGDFEALEIALAIAFLFTIELDLTAKNEVSRTIQSFRVAVTKALPNLGWEAQLLVNDAQYEVPIALMKRAINSPNFSNLLQVDRAVSEFQKKIYTWNAELKEKEERVARLQSSIDNQGDHFNFAGLREGFAELESGVVDELAKQQRNLKIFGLAMTIPSIIEIAVVISNAVEVSKFTSLQIAAVVIAPITLTLLFLYFFRISLRTADSCRAQLTQIRLRMALCRFIQRYTEYSVEVRSQNPDALSKFESLIFSGIVETSEKLPTTFDGMDQLTALLKSVKSK